MHPLVVLEIYSYISSHGYLPPQQSSLRIFPLEVRNFADKFV